MPFFIKISKTLMSLNMFKEVFQPQNVLIMFLFSMKHFYLLTGKIVFGVNPLMHNIQKWSDIL